MYNIIIDVSFDFEFYLINLTDGRSMLPHESGLLLLLPDFVQASRL